MKVILTPEESEEIFFSCLCNAVGTGYMAGYGLLVETDKEQWQRAKKKWKAANSGESPCYEDILMQILRDGGQLTFVDTEIGGEYTRSLKLEDVHGKVQEAPFRRLFEMVNHEDDVETADVILQHLLYGNTVFG